MYVRGEQDTVDQMVSKGSWKNLISFARLSPKRLKQGQIIAACFVLLHLALLGHTNVLLTI